jgi:hypothetical protein
LPQQELAGAAAFDAGRQQSFLLFLLFMAQYAIHKPLHTGETKRCVLACLQYKYFVYMQK